MAADDGRDHRAGRAIEALPPQVRRLYAAWKRWRGARRMPARGDIAPEDLRDLLPDVAIFTAASDAAVVDRILAGIFYDKDLLRGR